MGVPATKPMSDEEFFVLCKESEKAELIEGVMTMQLPASYWHEQVFSFLFKLLGIFSEEQDLEVVLGSRMALRLSKHNVFEPDLLFVNKSHQDRIKPDFIDGASDLVVEILSPGSRSHDTLTKKMIYERYGIPEYWLIDPNTQTASFLQLEQDVYEPVPPDEKGIYQSKGLPGFWIQVDWLWQDPPPKVFEVVRQILKSAQQDELSS